MHISEDVDAYACNLASRWGIDGTLARAVAEATPEVRNETGRYLNVISGFRSDEKQRQLLREGKTNLGPEQSNHTRCPATAVDVLIGAAPTNVQKALLGRVMVFHGLRWGGGSPVDPETGIPSDWNHFDLGPRSS